MGVQPAGQTGDFYNHIIAPAGFFNSPDPVAG